MKRFILSLCLVLYLMFPNGVFAVGDIRLGLSVGTNFALKGDVNFMFNDLFKQNFTKLTTENLKFNTINPNIGLLFGMEFMRSDKYSIGFSNNLTYQQEGFSVDMKGNNFDAIGNVTLNGLNDLLSFYVAYYPINRLSLNLGCGIFYESVFSDSHSTEIIKGNPHENDYEGSSISSYAVGLQLNFGVTYHITNNYFVSFTGYCNAVTFANSNEDMEQFFKELSDQNTSGGSTNPGGGFNPGGGGFNPGGGFKASKKTVSADDNIDMGYISHGLWYQNDISNRLTLLFTIGYRF